MDTSVLSQYRDVAIFAIWITPNPEMLPRQGPGIGRESRQSTPCMYICNISFGLSSRILQDLALQSPDTINQGSDRKTQLGKTESPPAQGWRFSGVLCHLKAPCEFQVCQRVCSVVGGGSTKKSSWFCGSGVCLSFFKFPVGESGTVSMFPSF